MNNRKKTLLLALVLALVLIGAAVGYRTLSAEQSPQITPMPVQQNTSPEEEQTDVPEEQEEDLDIDWTEEEEPQVALDTAPDFTAQDMEGNTVQLSELLDRPVILNFWATWCPPCREELPCFQAAYETYGDRVRFMMVNLTDGVEDTPESVAAFAAENGLTLPIYCDTEESAMEPYSIYAIPVTVAVARDGSVVWSQVGSLDSETLEQVIQMLLDTEANE